MQAPSVTDIQMRPAVETLGFVHGGAVASVLDGQRREASAGHSFNPNRYDLGDAAGRTNVQGALQEHRNGVLLNPQQHEPTLTQGPQVGQELSAHRSGAVKLDTQNFTMESANGQSAVSAMLKEARQGKTLEVARNHTDVRNAIADMKGAVNGKSDSFAQAVRDSQTRSPQGRGGRGG